jgi:hypothetical protein
MRARISDGASCDGRGHSTHPSSECRHSTSRPPLRFIDRFHAAPFWHVVDDGSPQAAQHRADRTVFGLDPLVGQWAGAQTQRGGEC